MGKETKYRYFIELKFDGTNYHGWQIQPNAISIQQILQTALVTLLKEKTELTGSGRTDTGVHATHYNAHFDSKTAPEKIKKIDLVYKLNRILPPDIAILSVRQVRDDAHARYSAISRSYEYLICRRKDPFFINRAWLMERNLDFDAMQEASEILYEYNDFEAFTKANTQVNNFKCNILHVGWRREEHIWTFHIKADRFLRNMVRAIVGTIADVGLGKISTDKMKEIIESKNRSKAGYSVPGCGLYFIGAEYPPEIYL